MEHGRMKGLNYLRIGWIALTLTVLADMVAPVMSVDDKCGACRVVAREIETALANERPRNHLDMRHRLDSKGNREGKLIDYKISELRVIELLEGICEGLDEYTYIQRKGELGGDWMSVPKSSLIGSDRAEATSHSKEIKSYCGRLLETTEEELTKKIRGGELSTEDVDKVLCSELTQHCTRDKKQGEDVIIKQSIPLSRSGGDDGEL